MAGTTQTQWWSQLIGESSSPTSAAVSRPSIACPARSSWAATSRPTTVTIKARITQGLIWDGPYTPVTKYVEFGDLPWFKEYHWTALQDLAGNAYILVGIALLALLTVVAVRSRRQGDRDLRSDTTEQASPDAVARPA